MSISLNSTSGRITYYFESGIKNPSSLKVDSAHAADIAGGSLVILGANGGYAPAGATTGAAALPDNTLGILLNDIVYEASAIKSNVDQGVTSYTELGHTQYSGTQAPGQGSFKTTIHSGLAAGPIAWDGTEWVNAAGTEFAMGTCTIAAAANQQARIVLTPSFQV